MKFLFIVTLTLIFSLPAFGQPQAQSSGQIRALEELRKLNSQLVDLYSAKKYDEALRVGKNILDIAARENLTFDARVLTAMTNLAEVYAAKGRDEEALGVLQTAANGYERMGEKGRTGLEKALSRAAGIYWGKADVKSAEAHYIKLKSLIEVLHGEKSRQMGDLYLKLANLYDFQNKYDEAEAAYQKAIFINDAFPIDIDKRADVESYECFIYHRQFKKNQLKEAPNIFRNFNSQRSPAVGSYQSQGIINGRAKSLELAQYPPDMKSRGMPGFVIVRVELDERGNVTKARAFCGIQGFQWAARMAALKSKFNPTTKNGIPVSSAGDIVYNFLGYN